MWPNCLMMEEEVKYLAELAKGRRVLEIGSYKGFSAIAMAPGAKSILCLDLFDSSNIPGLEGIETLDEFLENTKSYPNIKYMIGDSRTAHRWFFKGQFDMIFVDGDHSYEGCLNDIIHYWHKLEEGGLMVFHDFGKQFPGVPAACINFFDRLPDMKTLTLVVYYKY